MFFLILHTNHMIDILLAPTNSTARKIILFAFLEFANQLMDFSTAYEHRQYIGLLEKLLQFSKK